MYNFGGDTERTNLNLVRALLDKPDSLIDFVDDRAGHDRRYGIDFSRAAEELGRRPERVFEEGLRETVEWYPEHGDWVEVVTSGGR